MIWKIYFGRDYSTHLLWCKPPFSFFNISVGDLWYGFKFHYRVALVYIGRKAEGFQIENHRNIAFKLRSHRIEYHDSKIEHFKVS